jgi:hypothetical protein
MRRRVHSVCVCVCLCCTHSTKTTDQMLLLRANFIRYSLNKSLRHFPHYHSVLRVTPHTLNKLTSIRTSLVATPLNIAWFSEHSKQTQ